MKMDTGVTSDEDLIWAEQLELIPSAIGSARSESISADAWSSKESSSRGW